MHVLIVDDLRLNRIVLGKLLRSLDLHVIEACDGRAGLEAYLQHGRDVGMVFMDIMMPVCNGIQAVLSIRSAETRQGWLPVPIVAFTSEDVAQGSPLWCECMQSGFNDVVPKPMSKHYAVQLLCRWMPGLQQRCDAPCSPAASGASSDEEFVCSSCAGSAASPASCTRCGSSSAQVAASLMQLPQPPPLRQQRGVASGSSAGEGGSSTSVQQLRSDSAGTARGEPATAELEACSPQRFSLR